MARAALRDVHVRFGATQALRGAHLEIEPAQVHALLGQNGAGKTTLVRVLYGAFRPDRGTLELDGDPVELRDPRAALARGIGLVHQHFMLVPALSVAENLALGESGSGWLGRGELRARARALLAQYALELDPDAPAGSLAVAQQQRLEIVRALARGVRTLILDEPTAVLAPAEVSELLALLRRLRDEGRSVVFISHKLSEVTEVCDRVTVLRAGETVLVRDVSGLDAHELARAMVGQDPPPPGRPPEVPNGNPVALRLEGLRAEGIAEISLTVQSGEVVALAGIDGNGQGPLEEVLAGVRPLHSGAIHVERGPVALLSGDRQRTGLVLDLRVEENLILPEAAQGGRPPVFRHGWLSRDALHARARSALAPFGLRGTPESLARELSGGNQQKVCVARALEGNPGVIVAVNPTRGLDLEAAATVRQALRAQAARGAAVLLISTDLDEVLELGTRVRVLFRGRALDVPGHAATREQIGERMLGRDAPTSEP